MKRSSALIIGVFVVGLGLASACSLIAGDDVQQAAAEGEHASATSTTTTTTTTTTTLPPHPLTAPPPTVVPTLEQGTHAPMMYQVETTDPVVFLTIDDGITRDPSQLQRFTDMRIPVTAFLTKQYVDVDPDYWRAMQDQGWHTIHGHTIDHPNLRKLGETEIRRQICEPADHYTNVFGVRPTLFRAPYGNSNEAVERIARECGADAVLHWRAEVKGGEIILQRDQLQPGDIILMHYREEMHEDLDVILAMIEEEGLMIGRLEDYLSPHVEPTNRTPQPPPFPTTTLPPTTLPPTTAPTTAGSAGQPGPAQ